MKNLFICLAIIGLYSIPALAEVSQKKPVVINIFVDNKSSQNNGIPRSPICHPSLFIEDHTLSFSNSCVGFTLELVQDDAIVYTYLINSTDDLILPSYLSGTYQIRLVGGSFTFVGEIEL